MISSRFSLSGVGDVGCGQLSIGDGLNNSCSLGWFSGIEGIARGLFSGCFNSSVSVGLSYDSAGNMLSDGSFYFDYSEANMLSRVRKASSNRTLEEYKYDAEGKRLKKTEYFTDGINATTYYVHDNYEESYYTNGSTVKTTYVFANNERVASIKDGVKTYYLDDHLGSSSVILNESGDVIDRINYYPYGEVKARTGGATDYLYNSKELDDGTGLLYYGARYYDPILKRWTQPDTIIQNPYDPQFLNRYSYVRNNPLKYNDRDGHQAEGIMYVAYLVIIFAPMWWLLIAIGRSGDDGNSKPTDPQGSPTGNSGTGQSSGNSGTVTDQNVKNNDNPFVNPEVVKYTNFKYSNHYLDLEYGTESDSGGNFRTSVTEGTQTSSDKSSYPSSQSESTLNTDVQLTPTGNQEGSGGTLESTSLQCNNQQSSSYYSSYDIVSDVYGFNAQHPNEPLERGVPLQPV